MSDWESADLAEQRVPRREPEAEQQIADARAEPTIEELQAQAHDPEMSPDPVVTYPKAPAELYDVAMVRGLVRAAQFYESHGITRDDGTLWDDMCRDALEHARRIGLAPPRAAGLYDASQKRVVLNGPRLAAYLRLEAAAKAATAAQAALATTGAELRDAFGELCKVLAGSG